jgi:hypothetical protein
MSAHTAIFYPKGAAWFPEEMEVRSIAPNVLRVKHTAIPNTVEGGVLPIITQEEIKQLKPTKCDCKWCQKLKERGDL